MPPEYVTVFQIAPSSTGWLFSAIGLVPILIGCALFWAKKKFSWIRLKEIHWFLPAFFCAFGFIWVVFVGPAIIRQDSKLVTAYRNSDYSLVEGVVTDFHPMPYEGHQDECFSVKEKRFCYSDYLITGGFHNSASHGGPIREGLPVRIAYSNGVILRLDIPKNQALSATQSASIAASSEKDWQSRAEADPMDQTMSVAFLFVAVGWTLWWNLQWKRVMRYWLRPPYRRWTQIGFRVFFAANFVGAVLQLIQQLRRHPITKENSVLTIKVTVIMGAVVALISFLTLTMAERRDRKRNAAVQDAS